MFKSPKTYNSLSVEEEAQRFLDSIRHGNFGQNRDNLPTLKLVKRKRKTSNTISPCLKR